MPTGRIFSALLCAAAALACGGPHPSSEGFDGGSDRYALTLVGLGELVLHPAAQRVLKVLLTQDQVGPVANATIHFEFQDGDPLGARIDAEDALTDSAGVAAVSFTAGGESAAGRSFKLVASAPKLGANPVAFTFEVVPLHRVLQIVGGANVVPSEDGASAAVSVGASGTVGLRIRELDEATGDAIAGDRVLFTLPSSVSSRWNGAVDGSAVVTTGAGGDAQAVLVAPASAEAAFPVIVQSLAGGPPVTFMVAVQGPGAASCTTNAQCAVGQVCAGTPPHCQNAASCDRMAVNACPVGYVCVDGTCAPPLGNACDAQVRACAPDVTGLWLTRHDFSVRDALPAAVKTLAEALRTFDQAVKGKLKVPGLPDWLDSILRTLAGRLLGQYMPDWLRTVVAIGDDLFTLLTNIRAEGSMRVARNPDLTHLKGTEVWTSLVFYWLPLCGSGDVGGDVSRPPDCARIDLATKDASPAGDAPRCKRESRPAISVQLTPFTASLSGSGAGPYRLDVDRRQVRLEMDKIILALLDQLLGFVTPYHCIEEITDCSAGPGKCPLLDCDRFGRDAESATGGLVPAETLDAACASAVRSAGAAVTKLIANVWAPSVPLDFSGHALVSGSASASSCDVRTVPDTCAAKLGNDGYETALRQDPARRDGAWNGAFLFDRSKSVPGAWEAVRP